MSTNLSTYCNKQQWNYFAIKKNPLSFVYYMLKLTYTVLATNCSLSKCRIFSLSTYIIRTSYTVVKVQILIPGYFFISMFFFNYTCFAVLSWVLKLWTALTTCKENFLSFQKRCSLFTTIAFLTWDLGRGVLLEGIPLQFWKPKSLLHEYILCTNSYRTIM